MEAKQGKERGILKSEPRPRVSIDSRTLVQQGSWDRPPVSPQPSVDRLSVTWAEPEGSMTSSVNLFHLPSETAVTNDITFSPTIGDGSDDEDYSVSLSAVMRQRRASVRRSRKGKRRPSSSFLPDDPRTRRRSSVFTSSSGDTAISMEDAQSGVVTQEQIFENIHLHKEVLVLMKQQPLGMRRKLKIVHQAKGYIKKHEGQLQERLAQSKSTRDIYARFNIVLNTKWQQLKREAANMSNLLIPWELRIKEIESHFGSVVASYFTFLRWLFWVNLVIGFILMVFVIVPEYLTANPQQDGERKIIMNEERQNASNLLTLWEFEGVLKCSPIFYGYYTNIERPEYRMPLAYFLTGLVVYIYSFVATLRKMAENSRMSKLSEKEDECIFSWKLFTGWDFMIGNTETAHNRIASIILSFKEALLEEAEKKKDLRNWRIIALRAFVNICVVILLIVSAYAVITVVSRSDDNQKSRSWWSENETTIVVTGITTTFPICFEILGFLEHYHPRRQLRLQLARIMLLNLLNLYSLIFALFSKIEGMSGELFHLKPQLSVNASLTPDNILNLNETLLINVTTSICSEVRVPCDSNDIVFTLPVKSLDRVAFGSTVPLSLFANPKYEKKNKPFKKESLKSNQYREEINKIHEQFKLVNNNDNTKKQLMAVENLMANMTIDKEVDLVNNQSTSDSNNSTFQEESTTISIDLALKNELKRLRELVTDDNSDESSSSEQIYDTVKEYDADEYSFYGFTTDITSTDFSKFTSSNEPDYITETYLTTTSENSTNESYSDVITASTTEYNDSHTIDELTSSTPFFTESEFSSSKLDDITIQEKQLTSFSGTDGSSSISNSPGLVHTTQVLQDGKQSTILSDWSQATISYTDDYHYLSSTIRSNDYTVTCPVITFNCTVFCSGNNITQVYKIINCSVIEKKCYMTQCQVQPLSEDLIRKNITNITDVVYIDENNRKMYNLTTATKKKLLKLCWETMFGQELVKLTVMDLVFVLFGTLFMDFFRALFVRYMNRCWCWDLEKKFPEYGDFKIAENILHLINNQGMVWMGMFFSPGLVVLNVFKLVIMMYLRSWAVMTCNVPHEVVFRVSKSNNFYLALLLTMLFLCVLPVGYSIVWVQPSWHCGPFSEYGKIYHILTSNIYKVLPSSLNFTLEFIASPAIVIPLLVLLILIIYYLTSLTNSLREANNDLKFQLRRERTEERRKMFQLADTRRRVGSSAMDNTPFGRWKKALSTFPVSKSIDSDDRKTNPGDETQEPVRATKKKGSILAKIVNIALDRKKEDVEAENDTNQSVKNNTETDAEQETMPREVLNLKEVDPQKTSEQKKMSGIIKAAIFKIKDETKKSYKLNVQEDEKSEIKAVLECQAKAKFDETAAVKPLENIRDSENYEIKNKSINLTQKQTSESSTQSKTSDSIGSVIPVITISATESDEEILKEKNKEKEDLGEVDKVKRGSSESKSLRRQSSVDSNKEHKTSKDTKTDEGHKYQYSL